MIIQDMKTMEKNMEEILPTEEQYKSTVQYAAINLRKTQNFPTKLFVNYQIII
jgi:hypothetical protein